MNAETAETLFEVIVRGGGLFELLFVPHGETRGGLKRGCAKVLSRTHLHITKQIRCFAATKNWNPIRGKIAVGRFFDIGNSNCALYALKIRGRGWGYLVTI